LRDRPGPSSYAKRGVVAGTKKSAWNLLFDDFMLRHIKQCTETEARNRLENDEWALKIEDLEAFFGIMYVRGATGASKLALHNLWSNNYGVQIVKDAMPRNRFQEILRYLRFDEKSTRSQRLQEDKFALVSVVWNRFIENCQSCYVPGPWITVDEQLFPSKSRCRFTQFMANKPDKYGQKFFLAVDKEAEYVLNAIPYLGKDEMRPGNERLADYVVKTLVNPYLRKGRNVTTDNFFTSLQLAKYLKSQSTSIVGTMDRKRREVPEIAKKCKEELYHTQVLKESDATLSVYQGKRNKDVLILSTLHPEVSVESGGKKKPESVLCYNETKYGVDVVDQMAKKYSVKMPCRRWPVHTVCNILDLAAINAWVLYKEVTGEKISRREFILTLAEELVTPNKEQRGRGPTAEENADVDLQNPKGERKKCQVKKECQRNKTRYTCSKCQKNVCKKCIGREAQIILCFYCHEKEG